METRDADSMAETPEAHPEDRTRNVRTYGSSASSSTAREENSYLTASRLMEAVVERENMAKAHRRVVANGGAPGVDKMPVDALLPYLREQWARIKRELLEGRYKPQPVRIVEIPKPSGGVRMLGIPTSVDRLIQQALQQILTPIFDGTSRNQATASVRSAVPKGPCLLHAPTWRAGGGGWWTWTSRSSSTGLTTTS